MFITIVYVLLALGIGFFFRGLMSWDFDLLTQPIDYAVPDGRETVLEDVEILKIKIRHRRKIAFRALLPPLVLMVIGISLMWSAHYMTRFVH